MTEHPNYSFQDRKVILPGAAGELFSKHGFDGTSIRMISKLCGVNPAMTSYYFGSKERDDITRRIIDHIMMMVIPSGVQSKCLCNV